MRCNDINAEMFLFEGDLAPLEKKTLEIFSARLQKRKLKADPSVKITVEHNSACDPDEFRLSGPAGGADLKLECGSPSAFLYAVGKILRTGNYNNGIFSPGAWRGRFCPVKPIRFVYLASHFCNVFEMWPVDKMKEYIEDLALLGYNYFCMTRGTRAKIKDSPEAVRDLERRLELYRYANLLGMKVSAGCGNIGYDDSPAEWRAKPTGHSFFGTEICVSNPEGLDYIKKIRLDDFEVMRGLDVGIVIFWPYDQGGCGCPKCAPYGTNGMVTLARRMLPEIKKIWPDIKVCWSCWEFGEHANEWEELYKLFDNNEVDFIDFLEIDSHGSFPEYPLKHKMPEKFKFFTFPEISMWGRCPWGGFGATPLPKRFSALYGEIAHLSIGGRLYSEGIFEDFNKAIYAEMFNSGTNDTSAAMAEYARWELGVSKENYADFCQLVELMEENHDGLKWVEMQEGTSEFFFTPKNKPIWILKNKKWARTEEMLALTQKIDLTLPDWARTSWRWRLFMLRAIIDYELAHNQNEPNEVTEKAMHELIDIYGIDPTLASRRVSPFTDEWLKSHHKEAYKLNMKSLGVD